MVGLCSPRRTAVGIDENDSYHLIGRLLHACGLPVPRFHWADPARGIFLLEDLGDRHLQALVSGRPPAVVAQAYTRVLRLLVKLHRVVPARFDERFCFDESCYSAEFVYRRELEYFRREFLNGFLARRIDEASLARDFRRLADLAGVERRDQVIHRDFQSRNLMVQRGAIRIIDFQGMRYGPSVYDLASLLADPYVDLDPALQRRLERDYWHGISRRFGGDRKTFSRQYEAVRLCRHLQILGAYGFLTRKKGKVAFERYIPAAWVGLMRWLQEASTARQLPRLRACLQELANDGGCRKRLDPALASDRRGG